MKKDWSLVQNLSIREVVEKGNARARATAEKTMSEVRKAMKIDW